MDFYKDLRMELLSQYEPMWAVLRVLVVYRKISDLKDENLISPELAITIIEALHQELTTESLHNKKDGPYEEL